MIELRYATARNFTGAPLYPPEARCLLRRSVAERLVRAQDWLMARGLGLKVWDAYRPLAIQHALWRCKPDPTFIAPPTRGSRHNRGASVDVTLVDSAGRELEMPTDFDDFSPAAARVFSGCTPAAAQHRALLDEAMRSAGFVGIQDEWWHYDAPNWADFPLLDLPLVS